MKRIVFALILVFIALTLTGCATPVAEVARNPSAYVGEVLKIGGTAGKGFSIPLTKVTVFLLKDGKTEVPVVALKKPKPGSSVVVRGTIWAFPEEDMNVSATKVLKALEDFLVEKGQVERRKARRVTVPIFTAVKKLSRGLGHLWFIVEQE